MYAKHLLERSTSLRALEDHELDQVSGGADGDIVVVALGSNFSFGGFGISFGGFGGAAGGIGGYGSIAPGLGSGWAGLGSAITIPLELLDSDGDGVPDANDENPADASNDGIVVTANATLGEIQAANQLVQIDLAQLAIIGGALSPFANAWLGSLSLAGQSAVSAGAATGVFLGQPFVDAFLDQSFLTHLAQIQNPDGLGYIGYSAF